MIFSENTKENAMQIPLKILMVMLLLIYLPCCASTQSAPAKQSSPDENPNEADTAERAQMLIATSLQDEMHGNHQTAFDKRKEALALARKIQHHGLEIMALVGIATSYRTENSFKKALSYYLQAEAIVITYMGEETPTIIFILSSIGRAYEELGDFTNAISYHKRAIEISNKTQGVQNSETLGAMEDLGRAWFRYGKYNESLAACEEAQFWYTKLNRQNDPAFQRLAGCIAESKAYLSNSNREQSY